MVRHCQDRSLRQSGQARQRRRGAIAEPYSTDADDATSDGWRAARRAGRSTRFHHISAPVTNRNAGASPITTHTAFSGQSPGKNSPKCRKFIQRKIRSSGLRRGLSRSGIKNNATTRWNGAGNTTYTPVILHMREKAYVQKPTVLCSSQLNRFQFPWERTARLRRQLSI